tara:strand:+ start:4851 stop:5330 length:480 start_codon:yes stop_codon:yes gene_type:complete
MGRPLKRKNFGPLGSTTSTTGYPDTGDGRDQHGIDTTSLATKEKGYNIPVYKARIVGAEMDIADGAASNLFILSQKGARRFKIYSASNGIGVCKLVDNDGSSGVADGEMVVRGFVDTNGGEAVYIKKISGKKAYDFNNNAYTWYVENDSSTNVLILTAL